MLNGAPKSTASLPENNMYKSMKKIYQQNSKSEFLQYKIMVNDSVEVSKIFDAIKRKFYIVKTFKKPNEFEEEVKNLREIE